MFIRVMESSGSLEESARYFCASWDTFLFLSRKFFGSPVCIFILVSLTLKRCNRFLTNLVFLLCTWKN